MFGTEQERALRSIATAAIETTTQDHTTQLLACSPLEAAARLDPMLIRIDDVEGLARSANFSLRSSAAVLLRQVSRSSSQPNGGSGPHLDHHLANR